MKSAPMFSCCKETLEEKIIVPSAVLFSAPGAIVIFIGTILATTMLFQKLNRWMGAKRLVLYGAIINVLGTFATPAVATYLGAVPMVVLRFVMGFGQVSVLICGYNFLTPGALFFCAFSNWPEIACLFPY